MRALFFRMSLALVLPLAIYAQTPPPPSLKVSPSTATSRPGDVIVLTVTGPENIESMSGRALGQEHIPFYPVGDGKRWQGLIGIDLDVKPGSYPLTVSATRTGESASTGAGQLRIVAKQFPTRRLRVNGRFVDPPKEEIERITQESRKLSTVFLPITPQRWAGAFMPPTPGYPSSNFGSRSIYNGQPRNPHAGVDFGGDVGSPIVAPNAGEVRLAEDLYFTGGTVIVDHGLGLYSLFAHLSRIDVLVGQSVDQGATIGLLGATGRVTAPHLHWAVRLNGARVDPMSLIAALRAHPRLSS